jgi:molybdate transport system substrate-binding protein
MKSPASLSRRNHLLGAIAAGVLCILAIGCGKGDRNSNDERASEAKAAEAKEVVVAGASDLAFVMKEIVPLFEKEKGVKVKFSPGSSGNLAAQLREGAPYDVFFSANFRFVDDVIAAGACFEDTKALYARGRIVLYTDERSDPPPATIEGLLDPKYRKISIANPDHAPYGAAAKQAMEKAGLWDDLESRLVFGSNVNNALQFVDTGNAEVGIIALSLAIKGAKGHHVLLPDDLHRPIDQALAVCKRGPSPELGREFALFMGTPRIKAIMEEYGFIVPDAIDFGGGE